MCGATPVLREEARRLVSLSLFDALEDLLCQTVMYNEVTFYVWLRGGALHHVLQQQCQTDGRTYSVWDIHEDVPGIDHVGIISRISERFAQRGLPILYVNTYGHNVVFVSEEHRADAIEVLQGMACIDDFHKIDR